MTPDDYRAKWGLARHYRRLGRAISRVRWTTAAVEDAEVEENLAHPGVRVNRGYAGGGSLELNALVSSEGIRGPR
jgi:hypothetical protein